MPSTLDSALRLRAARAGFLLGFLLLSSPACHTKRPSEQGPAPPAKYVEMTVMTLAPTGHGSAVLLIDPDGKRILPIFVGGTEALSISLRLDKDKYKRPLTHDLLDNVIHELDGKLIQAQIDEVRDGVFFGSIVLRKGNRLASLDCRPSDAIALAIGNVIPIYVAQPVIDKAAIRREEVDRTDAGASESPPELETPL